MFTLLAVPVAIPKPGWKKGLGELEEGKLVSMDAFTDGEDPELHVVTVAVGDVRDGCLVGFATQCSIIPPRFVVCLSVLNETFALALRADALAVHRLQQSQAELARRFGGERGVDSDKFATLSWRSGVTGAPVLDGCAAYLEGTIQARIPFGDHWGFVLAPVAAQQGSEGLALRLSDVHVKAGHPPSEIFDR